MNNHCAMPKPKKDIAGMRFGALTAIQYFGNSSWVCVCDCGMRKTVRTAHLLEGATRSCGCKTAESIAAKKTSHGMCGSPEYRCWTMMKNRCLNEKSKDFANYGGRGITVCERWLKFENFLQDMGSRPSGSSIDRIDTNGNYEPSNCRWATRKQQNRNTRSNRYVEFRGTRMCVSELAEAAGIRSDLLFRRLRAGWAVQDAVQKEIRLISGVHTKCACGSTITEKQQRQYGSCDKCRRAK